MTRNVLDLEEIIKGYIYKKLPLFDLYDISIRDMNNYTCIYDESVEELFKDSGINFKVVYSREVKRNKISDSIENVKEGEELGKVVLLQNGKKYQCPLIAIRYYNKNVFTEGIILGNGNVKELVEPLNNIENFKHDKYRIVRDNKLIDLTTKELLEIRKLEDGVNGKFILEHYVSHSHPFDRTLEDQAKELGKNDEYCSEVYAKIHEAIENNFDDDVYNDIRDKVIEKMIKKYLEKENSQDYN